jgi:hypothetical protein
VGLVDTHKLPDPVSGQCGGSGRTPHLGARFPAYHRLQGLLKNCRLENSQKRTLPVTMLLIGLKGTGSRDGIQFFSQNELFYV